MYDDWFTNVVSDMKAEPLYPEIEISLSVDVLDEISDLITSEQDELIEAAMHRHARALEREVADILGLGEPKVDLDA